MNELMGYVVYQMEALTDEGIMSYGIRWFVSEFIECYCLFVNCRGS